MKLGCNIHPDTVALHASLPMAATQLLPAYSRIIGTPRIEGGNQQIGDCVIVAGFNALQTHLAMNGNFSPLPNDLPPQIYSEITGYVPGNEATDNGTDPVAFLTWWQDNAICGYKLDSTTRLNPADEYGIRNSISNGAVRGVYLCVTLTDLNMNEDEWVPGGENVGGHAIWGDSYEALDTGVTSWGLERTINHSFFAVGQCLAAWGLNIVAA